MNASQSDTDRTPPAPESWSAALDPRLVALLEQHQARAETVDPWTARFHAVPVAEGCFNKARTNLLLQRTGMESGATVYVDGDLAYHGPDRTVNTILAGPCRFALGPAGTARYPSASVGHGRGGDDQRA